VSRIQLPSQLYPKLIRPSSSPLTGRYQAAGGTSFARSPCVFGP
jgi:hypothetical protein